MPAKGEILDLGIGWGDKPARKVQRLRPTAASKRIACCLADVHFSHSVPGSRAETREEWYQAQLKFCHWLNEEYRATPIFVAGDLTENWNEPPELINFLIQHMPTLYAIAGNHDLPNHQLQDIGRSAYWTLVQANKINHMQFGWYTFNTGLAVYGYHYGKPVTKSPGEINPDYKKSKEWLRLALVHANVWSSQDSAYPGVKQEEHIDHYHFLMKANFDSVLFGDNHVRQTGYIKGFDWCNPGPIMQRTVKEKDQPPAVAELFDDGHFEFRKVPDFEAKWKEDPTTIEATEIDVRKLAELLTRLGDSGVDYLNALKQAVNSHECRKSVRNLVNTIVQELKVLAQKTGDRL